MNGGIGPFRRGRDRIALVTRGHHPAFQAVWADIKNACPGSDPALAIARIRSTKKHKIIFDNIKIVIQESLSTVRDEDVIEFIGLLTLPLPSFLPQISSRLGDALDIAVSVFLRHYKPFVRP